MLSRVSIVWLLTGGLAFAQTTGPSRSVPAYTAQQFYQTETISTGPIDGRTFSSDGSRILFGSDRSGVINVYTVPIIGGDATALTQSNSDARFPVSFFPKDDRVLFRGDIGGNELTHLYVRETNGSISDLTPGDKLKAEFVLWAADEASFFVMSNERDPKAFDLYRYAVDRYARSLICQNPGEFTIRGVSPDGRWVGLEKARTNADSDLYLYDTVAKSEFQLVTPRQTAREAVKHTFATFTLDSKALYFLTNRDSEFDQLWSLNLDDGAGTPRRMQLVEKAPWDISYTAFSPDGKYRVTGVNNDARTELRLVNLAGETLAIPELPALDITSVQFSNNSTHMAFLASADTSSPNLFVLDMAGGSPKKLTDTMNPSIKEANLVSSQVVRYPSFDDLRIPAILYRPQGASATRKVPALVWVHGGPGGQTRVGYNAQLQFLVNHGYAVLGVNNRGSSGYGKTFYHLDDKKHGDVDLQDCIYGRKYLEQQDWVDAQQIGIIGGSYGGYMTAAALALTPDAFEVGIDIFGPTNWVRTLESIPAWWAARRDALYSELGDPATDKERLLRISPLFHAKNIKKPLMVIQGANDPRVLQRESDELVVEARKNGAPVEYLVFPDEGHGFLKKENRIEAADKQLLFLKQYLPAK